MSRLRSPARSRTWAIGVLLGILGVLLISDIVAVATGLQEGRPVDSVTPGGLSSLELLVTTIFISVLPDFGGLREGRVRRQGRQWQDHALLALHSAPGGSGIAGRRDRRRHQPASGRRPGLDEDEAAKLPALGDHLAEIKDYLRGDNPRIGSTAAMVKTTPPGRGSRLLRVGGEDPVHALGAAVGGTRLMVTGPFSDDDLGVACYHSKTGAVELYLNHLVDGPGEYVVVDMTAGADTFASGLFTRFDLLFLVAEPTRKGVSVYRQYVGYAADYDVPIKVIGNKVQGDDDLAYLRAEVGADLLTWCEQSAAVRALEQGRPGVVLEQGNQAALRTMQAALDAAPRTGRSTTGRPSSSMSRTPGVGPTGPSARSRDPDRPGLRPRVRVLTESEHARLSRFRPRRLRAQAASRRVADGQRLRAGGPRPAAYDAVDDYPPYVLRAAEGTAKDPDSLGIVIGGSGNGEAIAANKVKGSALRWPGARRPRPSAASTTTPT